MVTIEIRRAHLVTLAVALAVLLPLCAVGAVGGVLAGRSWVLAQTAPAKSAPKAAPPAAPVRYFDVPVPTTGPIVRLGPSCAEQWQSYQRAYTDYQIHGGLMRPIEPSCSP